MMSVTHKAAFDFEDPEESTTLTLKTGDGIQVTEKGEHWWYGRNMRTGEEGYFPPKFVSEMRASRGLNMPSVQSSQPRMPRPSRDSESYKINEGNSSIVGMSLKDTAAQQSGGDDSSRPLPNAPGEGEGGYGESTQEAGYSYAKDDPQHSLIKLKESSNDATTTQQTTQKGNSLWETENFQQPLLGKDQKMYSNIADDFKKGGSVYRFSVMSHYMGMYACLVGLMIGGSFFYYNLHSKWHHHTSHLDKDTLVTKIFSMAACPILFIFEYAIGLSPVLDVWPQWAVVYAAISIPFFLRWQTILTGICFLLTAVFKLIAYCLGEKVPKVRKRKKKGCCENSCKDCCYNCCKRIRGAYWNLAFLYMLSQAAIIAERLHYWIPIWLHDKHKYTVWFVVAKTAGTLLDMNGSFVLLPMCRTLIRMAYNVALRNKCLSIFLTVFSLDTMLHMHILIAMIILTMGLLHTFAHFANYAVVGWTVYKMYGIQIWFTGGALVVIMQMLYSASPSAVRRDKFEQFWYFHHLFIPFEILLFFHGKHYFGPNYYKWIIVPGILYIVERIMRAKRANQPVGVVSVTHMENNQFKVLCLELEKKGPLANFYEGQYVFLKCETISKYQWHPFTISSAPQNDTVHFHIRNMGPKSWTGRFQDYLLALAPLAAKRDADKTYYKITHIDKDGNRKPQVIGPNNIPIVKVDGPMAAPTQHIREYDRVMIIGSGIGVTPVRASLESVIHHRLKYAVGAAKPDHAHFYWVVSWKHVESFLFMIRTIKEACDEWTDLTMKEKDTTFKRTFEMHIFVTSPPKKEAKSRKNPRKTLVLPQHHQRLKHDIDDERHIWGPSRHVEKKGTRFAGKKKIEKHKVEWGEWELYESLKDPPPKGQVRRWGPVVVHSGRPNWPEMFEDVTKKANEKLPDERWSVGVCFCGNPIIGADLTNQCRTYTKKGNTFRMHKENF